MTKHAAALRWSSEAIRAEHEEREARKKPRSEVAESPGRPDKPPKAKPARVDQSPIDSLVDSFLAERVAGGFAVPTRQAILDRISHVLGNVNLLAEDGVNSRKRNAHVFIVGRDAPPYFGVGTEAE